MGSTRWKRRKRSVWAAGIIGWSSSVSEDVGLDRAGSVYLWYYLDIQIRQIASYLALGIVLGSAVSVFGKKYIGAFAKIGQRKMGWLGVIPASLLGIASPLCMYGTIPIAASFSEQGVKDDYLAAFYFA